MKIQLFILCFAFFTLFNLSAQVIAGDATGLSTNLPVALETVDIFTPLPQFLSPDNQAFDSLDLNRDGQMDVEFLCISGNVFDNSGGATGLNVLHPKVSFMVDNQHFIRQLGPGDLIAGNQTWEQVVQAPLVTKVSTIGGYQEYGNWLLNPEGYAGIRIISGTDTLYGWLNIQATVFNGNASLKVLQWAIEPAGVLKNEETPALKMNVLPNPVHDVLTIENAGNTILYVKITDLSGKEISFPEVVRAGAEASFDMTKFPAGIYWLSARDADGNRLGFKKIIKM